MTKQLARLTLVLVLVSLACALPAYADPRPTPKAVSQLLVTSDPRSTVTPTPFQPVGPTATALTTATTQPAASATALANAAGTPEATAENIPGMPTPIRVSQKLPEGMVTFLVLGNDWRANAGYRTDIIQLVAVNTGKGTISVVSFPRDLYVTIPGWGENRINTAFPHGGISMMADTLQYNFGIRPTYYVMTNFQGFTGIINSLGGVQVHVGQYLRDKCDLPQAVNTYCTVNPGVVTMNGATALWYVRSRHSSRDFERGKRSQEVLYAVFAKLMSLNAVAHLPELYNTYKSSVETNMGLDVITPLMPVASQAIADSSRIQRFNIGPGQVTPYTTSGGAAVLLPNYDAIVALLNQAIFSQ